MAEQPNLSTPAPQYSPLGTATATTASGPALNLVAPPSPITSPAERRPGHNYDPYDSPGERAEGFFVGILFGKLLGWLGKLLGIATLDDPSGFMSTYREWHISWRGAYDGFRSKTFGDVPECPPLWQDEAQYYEGFAMFFNVVKCQWPTVAAAIIGYGGMKVAGIA